MSYCDNFHTLLLYSSTLVSSLTLITMQCAKKKNIWTWSKKMSRNYGCVKFVNLSMSSLGVFSNKCSTFLDIMNDIGIDKKQQRLYIIKKMINMVEIGILFCNFDFLSFLFFFFFLNDPISSNVCKLSICSEIYNSTFKNKNKVSIIHY